METHFPDICGKTPRNSFSYSRQSFCREEKRLERFPVGKMSPEWRQECPQEAFGHNSDEEQLPFSHPDDVANNRWVSLPQVMQSAVGGVLGLKKKTRLIIASLPRLPYWFDLQQV